VKALIISNLKVTLPFIILMTILISVGNSAAESPWPMFRHDLKNTGRTNFTGPGQPVLSWKYETGDGVTSSPSIGHNGTIYVGSGGYRHNVGDSSLYALNPDGTLKWKFGATTDAFNGRGIGIFSSPAINDNGTIYFGSLGGKLYSIDDSITYAKENWFVNFSFWPVYGSPAVAPNGNIYVGGLNLQIYGVSQAGEIIWKKGTGWCVFSSPLIRDDGSIIVGSKDHRVYALKDSIESPIDLWNYKGGNFYDGHLFDCSPALGDDGTIYIGADPTGAAGIVGIEIDTGFFAINSDGTLKWKFATGSGVEGTPAVGHDGTIYFGCFNGKLFALADRGDHAEELWSFQTGLDIEGAVTVDGDGTIYVGSRDSTLYALNPDGSLKWSFDTDGGIASSVTVGGDGYIYFGSYDKHVYCLGTGNPDVGLETLNVPDLFIIGQTIVPSAILKNYRMADRTSDAIFQVYDDAILVYADTLFNLNLAGGEAQNVYFDSWQIPEGASVNYTVTAFTLIDNDDNPNNDSLTLEIVSAGGAGCCLGESVGNMDSVPGVVDIGDLTVLIDFLFISFEPIICLEEADVDLSGQPLPEVLDIDIGDLTLMIDHLFLTLIPLPACP